MGPTSCLTAPSRTGFGNGLETVWGLEPPEPGLQPGASFRFGITVVLLPRSTFRVPGLLCGDTVPLVSLGRHGCFSVVLSSFIPVGFTARVFRAALKALGM
jgi:hypothetical protein